MRRESLVLGVSLLAYVLVARHDANAQTANYSHRPVRRYNGIDAGEEAYLIHENQRRGAITAQMALNDDMQMLRGLPPKYFEYFPANPFDVLLPGPAVDAVWSTPYYPADPFAPGAAASPDAPNFEADEMGAIDDTAAAVDRLFEPPAAPTPNPPRPANAAARAAQKRPLLNRAGQPLRPEELPAPAEVRERQRRGGPREF